MDIFRRIDFIVADQQLLVGMLDAGRQAKTGVSLVKFKMTSKRSSSRIRVKA